MHWSDRCNIAKHVSDGIGFAGNVLIVFSMFYNEKFYILGGFAMNYVYDLLIKNGHVIDPKNKVNGIMDIGVKDSKIKSIGELDPANARKILDAKGQIVIPGIIDLHTHLDELMNGRCGHAMLAAAGVTTALEIAGPIDTVLPIAKSCGAGLNIALLENVRPGQTVQTIDPSSAEIEALLEETQQKGGLGVKILGGHYPITPEAVGKTIAAAYEKKAYMSFHAGSTEKGSNIEGFLEGVDLADGKPLHMAHINSYCRGQVYSSHEEAEIAIEALIANPNICAESYLSAINGCDSLTKDGLPESLVTRRCLRIGGYSATDEGLQQAIFDGWAQVNMSVGDRVILGTGEEGHKYWLAHDKKGVVSFAVNPFDARARLATAKNPQGGFVVPCIGTDGGGIPRNVIVESGLSLVKMDGLKIEEFVQKTSVNPARWLGLKNKGHLSEGADADITIIDMEKQKAIATIGRGELLMYRGLVVGSGAHIITTEKGQSALAAQGFTTTVIDIENTGYFQSMK